MQLLSDHQGDGVDGKLCEMTRLKNLCVLCCASEVGGRLTVHEAV
jgi:hypothetical protein